MSAQMSMQGALVLLGQSGLSPQMSSRQTWIALLISEGKDEFRLLFLKPRSFRTLLPSACRFPPAPQFGNVLIHPTVMQGFQVSEHLCGIKVSGRAILSLITASFRKECDTVTILGAIVKAVEGILEAKVWVFYRVNEISILNTDYLQR